VTATKKKTAKRRAAPKRAKAARTVPKVSPARGMDVSAWVKANADGWRATVVGQLLAIAKRALPDATISIKWNQPVVEQDGPIAFVKPATAHVTFGFWRGAEILDPENKLTGGARMKHVKLGSARDIDERSFTAWLVHAARLNAEHGDPSRRH
jgi:hypothetical protein